MGAVTGLLGVRPVLLVVPHRKSEASGLCWQCLCYLGVRAIIWENVVSSGKAACSVLFIL